MEVARTHPQMDKLFQKTNLAPIPLLIHSLAPLNSTPTHLVQSIGNLLPTPQHLLDPGKGANLNCSLPSLLGDPQYITEDRSSHGTPHREVWRYDVGRWGWRL